MRPLDPLRRKTLDEPRQLRAPRRLAAHKDAGTVWCNGTGLACTDIGASGRQRRFERIMKHKLSSAILASVIGLALTCGPALAQASDQSEKSGSANRNAKITGQTMTVTGCLTKDEKEKNEYLITGEDGKTWGLKSSSVKLGDHLNHKVTVTGKVTKEGHEKEAGDLNVSNLKMVSESCQ